VELVALVAAPITNSTVRSALVSSLGSSLDNTRQISDIAATATIANIKGLRILVKVFAISLIMICKLFF